MSIHATASSASCRSNRKPTEFKSVTCSAPFAGLSFLAVAFQIHESLIQTPQKKLLFLVVGVSPWRFIKEVRAVHGAGVKPVRVSDALLPPLQ